MRRLLVVLATAIAAVAFYATPAFAGGTVAWAGGGSDNLPCSGNEHWILSGNADVTSAELWVDGQDMGAFSQSGQGSWSIDTNFGFDGTQSVSAVWTGTGSPHLVLSHCDTETSTTGGTSGGTTGETTGNETTGNETTGSETTGSETTGSETTTGNETTGNETTTGSETTGNGSTTGSGGVSGATTGGTGGTAGGTTGGTAATPSGGNLPFTGLPLWIPLLVAAAMLASGGVILRRRKGEIS